MINIYEISRFMSALGSLFLTLSLTASTTSNPDAIKNSMHKSGLAGYLLHVPKSTPATRGPLHPDSISHFLTQKLRDVRRDAQKLKNMPKELRALISEYAVSRSMQLSARLMKNEKGKPVVIALTPWYNEFWQQSIYKGTKNSHTLANPDWLEDIIYYHLAPLYNQFQQSNFQDDTIAQKLLDDMDLIEELSVTTDKERSEQLKNYFKQKKRPKW